MYVVIHTEEGAEKLLYTDNSYPTLCEMVFLEETEPCVIVPGDNVSILFRSLRNLSSDALFNILTDLGGDFESDDNESYLEERLRLVTGIFEKISSKSLRINGFELSSQVLWKERNAAGKSCRYLKGKMIPKIL